jgi:SAM-dependent methyltransferase
MDSYQPQKTEKYQENQIKNSNEIQKKEEVRKNVRDAYGKVAEANSQNKCCGNSNSCCGVSAKSNDEYSKGLGYTQEEIKSAPKESNMGLGCGNPQAIASLKQGDIVLDLGAGGGFDAFLASSKVGPSGKVYGVDMTPEMLSQARSNAIKNGYRNVEFLLGEIEHLPLPNESIDVIISNCVINLSTDKAQVFREAFRVLKNGGRLAISDMVAYKPLPVEMINNKELYCNCISGAMPIDELKKTLSQAGFSDISIETDENTRTFIKDWVPDSKAENYVISAKIKAVKGRIK